MSGGLRPRPGGFTLVELMVALAIFAVIAAIAYAGLDLMLRQWRALHEAGEALRAPAFALHAVERDLRQAVVRPVRDEFGAPLPALLGSPERIELTVASPRLPPAERSIRLSRVVWFRDGEQLRRGRWQMLDRAPGSGFDSQSKLDGLRRLRLSYLDAEGRWRERWPPIAPAGADTVAAQELLPRAVELRLETGDGIEHRRLIVLQEGR